MKISKTAKMTVLKVIEGLPSSTKADFTALFFQANSRKQKSLKRLYLREYRREQAAQKRAG